MSDKNLLEKIKAEYEQKNAEMELRHKQEMDLLKEQLSSMRKLLFLSKSERTKIVLPNPDQLTLFDEVEQEAAPEPSEEATTVKAHKRKKQHTQKKLDLSKAERNVVVLDNSSLHYLCSGRKSCGRLWGLTSASRPWPTGFSMHTGIISNHLLG